MVFPFSRGHQERAAESLRAKLERGLLPIIHVVDFPGLRINHALLLTNARDSESAILFDSYDPNHPEQPARIRFDRRDRRFYLEPTSYFTGGPVTVYEVYQNLWF